MYKYLLLGMLSCFAWLGCSTDKKPNQNNSFLSKEQIEARFQKLGFTSGNTVVISAGELSESIDLRSFDTPVKSQGASNLCWAFAEAAAIENQLKSKTGNDYDLSEEHYADSIHKHFDQNLGSVSASDYLVNEQARRS